MSAKDLRVEPMGARAANAFMRRMHYSGKVVRNSQLHLGVLWEGRVEGVLQFGPSLDKRKLIGLVEGTEWDQFLELNRMAFSERLPRNSESRAIAVSMRLIRKHAPRVKWIVSFADATQCGDGTIYRASGFVLTGIKTNKDLARLPDGSVIHTLTLHSGTNRPRPEAGGRSYFDVTGGRYDFPGYIKAVGGEILTGHQMRYLYFLDQKWRDKLTVPEVPFAEIARLGAGMYLGERASVE